MLGVTFLPISPGTVIDLILHPVGTAPFICIHLWLLNFFFFFAQLSPGTSNVQDPLFESSFPPQT